MRKRGIEEEKREIEWKGKVVEAKKGSNCHERVRNGGKRKQNDKSLKNIFKLKRKMGESKRAAIVSRGQIGEIEEAQQKYW